MKPIAFFPDDSSLVVILPVTLTFSASLYRCVETSARSSRLDNHCAASPMLWMFTCCQSRLRGKCTDCDISSFRDGDSLSRLLMTLDACRTCSFAESVTFLISWKSVDGTGHPIPTYIHHNVVGT